MNGNRTLLAVVEGSGKGVVAHAGLHALGRLPTASGSAIYCRPPSLSPASAPSARPGQGADSGHAHARRRW